MNWLLNILSYAFFTLEIICKLACIAKFNNRVPNRKIQLFSKLPSVLNFKKFKSYTELSFFYLIFRFSDTEQQNLTTHSLIWCWLSTVLFHSRKGNKIKTSMPLQHIFLYQIWDKSSITMYLAIKKKKKGRDKALYQVYNHCFS